MRWPAALSIVVDKFVPLVRSCVRAMTFSRTVPTARPFPDPVKDSAERDEGVAKTPDWASSATHSLRLIVLQFTW